MSADRKVDSNYPLKGSHATKDEKFIREVRKHFGRGRIRGPEELIKIVTGGRSFLENWKRAVQSDSDDSSSTV
jgi:hypothetical protein